jgi:hypothetical protein
MIEVAWVFHEREAELEAAKEDFSLLGSSRTGRLVEKLHLGLVLGVGGGKLLMKGSG